MKRLISDCRAIYREPLYSMGPFGTIVRLVTIALCFDTLHTGPYVCTRATDVDVKCGDVCYQNIDFWLQHSVLPCILKG